MPSSPSKVVLYWHRTDLRLHVSPALHAALALNPSTFIPVWTWDPHYVYRSRVGPNRWRFLLECQSDLSESYKKLNAKQKLWVVREAPQSVLPKLWEAWGVTHLVFEKDTDSYAKVRDEEVLQLAEKAGVEVIVKMGRNLFDPDELVAKNGGKATMSMSQVAKAADKINSGQPEMPLDAPKSIPDPWDWEKMKLDKITQDGVNAEPDLNAEHRTSKDEQYTAIMGPKNDFGVPTLEEIGIEASIVTTPHRGGETEALKLLSKSKPKTSPADFEPQSTTLLSPHHHFGTLSVRKVWWDVQEVLKKRKAEKKPTSSIPTNLPGQMLFRDMYFAAQAAVGPAFATTQELLIDHETACNAGNWMWLSCTAFFAQFYRCYSPVAFGRKWDPEGHFVRRCCPELAQFDKKYIYEPWKAPIADQKKWGCRVTGDGSDSTDGQTYPKPMFDFDERRQICLDSMKSAHDVGLHGADKEVMTGSWKGKFDRNEKPPKRQKTE
ncbi:hypothetical protein N7486_006392 [Penicillium sp. IBT 16267x]|nr:hypothetical protein N7486_006392 [Penicillium sp. IBT 16267x]